LTFIANLLHAAENDLEIPATLARPLFDNARIIKPVLSSFDLPEAYLCWPVHLSPQSEFGMRVIVTGVSGFVGNYVVQFLAAADFDVVGCYRRETPSLANLVGKGIRLVRADLADAARLPGPFDGIVHIAATSPDVGISVEQMVNDNVSSMLALIAAARMWKSRAFILFSSLSVHGEITTPVIDETCPVANPDAYGTTKRLNELMLAEQACDMPGLALRLPGVLGPHAHRNWLSGVGAKLCAGETVRAFHLDAPFNNAAHVADISNLIARVLQCGWEGFDAIVLGARGTIRVREAIERLARGLGVSAMIEPIPSNKPSFILSSERAVKRWGYDPMEIGAMIDRYADDMLATRLPKSYAAKA
jgi:nucleoside-diphosphate-sugar epimerase